MPNLKILRPTLHQRRIGPTLTLVSVSAIFYLYSLISPMYLFNQFFFSINNIYAGGEIVDSRNL